MLTEFSQRITFQFTNRTNRTLDIYTGLPGSLQNTYEKPQGADVASISLLLIDTKDVSEGQSASLL